MRSLFVALARDIAAEVTRRADPTGNVPRSATFEIQQVAGQLVQRLFLGRNRTGELAPFDTLPNGALIPLSPYMRQLWESIKAVVRIPVEQNAVILANKLPADVLIVMRNATGNPFVAAKRAVSEQVFRPNPLAVYAAPHEWVDPNGYRLSDRIWNVAATERRRLDVYLDTAIREGRGALRMSRELEQFLIPGQSLPETNAPYGTTASFDAMRLARTEIARAHGHATEASAAMNPFVTGLKWNLSARHPRYDICDEYARGGPNGDGTYALGEAPAYPAHPQCICFLTNVLANAATSTNLIDELRADIQRTRQEFVNLAGPLQVEQFERLLLGQGLTVEGQTFTRVVGAPTLPPVLPPVTPVVIEPPPVVVEPSPVVVEPPPAPPVVEPVFDRDDPAQVRAEIVELDQRYKAQIASLNDQIAQKRNETAGISQRLDDLAMSGATTPDVERTLREQRTRAWDERVVLQKKLKAIEQERDGAASPLLRVSNPAAVTMNAADQSSETVTKWQSGVNDFNKLVSADVAPPKSIYFTDTSNTRSSYNPESKFLRLTDNVNNRTIVHELGHWLEDHNPEVHRKTLEFYNRRTQGEPLEWMGPGFDRSEVTRKDRFVHPYMGKYYLDGGQQVATEIVSMGLEYFYSQPYKLATEDPDMFDFIFNLLRGR